MRKFSSLLDKFVKEHALSKNSLLRLVGTFCFSTLIGGFIIYQNNETYWKVTIGRVQTVDFNILANILPSKLSKQLLNNDKKGLQATLDSNYGLFGMVVTDCKSTDINCPQQKILYASQAKVNTSADGNQALEIQRGKYPASWADSLIQTDNPAQQLTGDFLVLRDPPPLKQEWKFDDPRALEKTLTGEQNNGNIIGRVYLLRGKQPSFQSELGSWLQSPLKDSSKNIVYNAIASSAMLTGIIVWLLTELAAYIKINADRKELEAEKKISEVTQRELDAERKIRQATEQLILANQSAVEARNLALNAKKYAEAVRELESKTQQDKIDAQNKAIEAERLAIEAEQRASEVEKKLEQINNDVEKERMQFNEDRKYILNQIGDDNSKSRFLYLFCLYLILIDLPVSTNNSENKKSTNKIRKSRFSDAYEALVFAGEAFPILEIFNTAIDSSKATNGGLGYSPDRVFKDLAILAHVGSDYFAGKFSNNLHKILKQRNVDSSGESYTVRNQDGSRRFNGIDMYDHLKIGDLRIHFYFDIKSQRIQVGYCGKHL